MSPEEFEAELKKPIPGVSVEVAADPNKIVLTVGQCRTVLTVMQAYSLKHRLDDLAFQIQHDRRTVGDN